MCPSNSITNGDGTCTCQPGFAPDGKGNCVSFDYNAASAAGQDQSKWKDFLNQYGPVALGGFAAWWAAQQKPQTTPAGTLPSPQDPPSKPGVPVWAWVAGGLVVVVILIAVLRRSAGK